MKRVQQATVLAGECGIDSGDDGGHDDDGGGGGGDHKDQEVESESL